MSHSAKSSAKLRETFRAGRRVRTSLPVGPSPSQLADIGSVQTPRIIDDGVQSFRMRRGDNRPLPLPPSLDPLRLAVRANARLPGRDPNPEETERFHAQFIRNPHARILASPLRYCLSTRARVPADLLTKFSLKAHPTTGDPHLVPAKLHLEAIPYDSRPPKGGPGANPGTSRYLSLRDDLLTHTSQPSNAWGHIRGSFSTATPPKTLKRMKWRPDMPEHVRALLRKAVAWRLRRVLAAADPAVLAPGPGGARAAGDVDGVAAVVYLRSRLWTDRVEAMVQRLRWSEQESSELRQEVVAVLKTRGGALLSPAERELMDPPLTAVPSQAIVPPLIADWVVRQQRCFNEVEYRGRVIPVYSLADYFGEEEMRELVEGTEYADMDCVLLKDDKHAMDLHRSITKLDLYTVRGI